MGEVKAVRSEFARKEGGDVSRDGKIELGGEGWFATEQGWRGGDGKGVIHLWLRN